MIDDITLVHRFGPHDPFRAWSVVPGVPVYRLKGIDRRRRREVEFGIVRGRGMNLRFCEATGEVRLKLSIPRLLGRTGGDYRANWPLRAVSCVKDLPINTIAAFVLKTLGLAGTGRRPGDLRIESWGVTRIAYALDADVGEEHVGPTIAAIGRLRREQSRKSQTWSHLHEVNTVQWGTKERRTMIYAKAAEIRSHIAPLKTSQDQYERGSVSFREALAARAAGTVRLEVTLGNARHLRKLWGLGPGALPTLRLMTHSSVGDYVLGDELRKLGLKFVAASEVPDDPAGEARVEMLMKVLDTLRAYNEGQQRPEMRRKEFSLMNVLAFYGYYTLAGQIPDRRMVARWGGGESTLSEMKRQLKLLGLPPVGTDGPAAHRRLAHFMAAVQQVLPRPPAKLPKWKGDPFESGFVIEAPWVGELFDDDDAMLERDRDVEFADFTHVLEGVDGDDDEAAVDLTPDDDPVSERFSA